MTKKIALLLVFLCFTSVSFFAENSDTMAFKTGKIILSLGYGFPNLDKASFDQNFRNKEIDTYKSTCYGPFHFRGEYGLSNKIGIGVSFNYNTYSGSWSEGITSNPGFGPTQYYTYEYKQTLSSFTGLIRFNYHFATTNKLDPYFAVGGGLKKTSKTITTNDPDVSRANYIISDHSYSNSSNYAIEVIAGMRYYFTKTIAIYSEIGASQSVIQIGMSVGF